MNPFSRRESIGVRWPRGWTVRGSLVKFATVQQFKWGTLERSKVRSLCVHPAWHLRGSTTMFLSPGNAWFGRGGKRGHGRVDLHSRSLSSRQIHSFLLKLSASFLPYEWLYSLAPLDSSPSGGRHLNWTVAIAGVSSRPPARVRARAGIRKSVLFQSTLLLWGCVFQKLSSSRQL